MNFFEHQDRARRRTSRLVVLFVIAVVMILLAVNAAAIGISILISNGKSIDPVAICVIVTAATLIIIVGGSLYKTAMLAYGGGSAVAAQMGGRPINPQAGPKEQILQNVVEEMAIASGVPVPRIYVMNGEEGINAFAAGFTPNDAVIAVTRGTLEKLNRDELQGVIAHEFSHIFNGDMRLNLRLIGILHGILLIAMTGYVVLRMFTGSGYGYSGGWSGSYRSRRSRDDDKSGAGLIFAILLSAVGLIVIGSVGVFFGRLIQAAVSRQREFLADASAVQFTRNPAGIVGALKKIGQYSSHIHDGHAMGAAHMFFGNIVRSSWTSLLSTHPPLVQRIKAIDPTFNGELELGSAATEEMDEFVPISRGEGLATMLAPSASQRLPLDAPRVIQKAGTIDQAHLTYAGGLLQGIPDPLTAAAREPFSARAVVFVLLINEEPAIKQQQHAILEQNVEPQCVAELHALQDAVAGLAAGARLPLLDLALPALRQLSPPQAGRFKAIIRAMIEADGRVTLFEYALNRIIEKQLGAPGVLKREPMSFFAVGAVRDEAAVILSALASASSAKTDFAFEAGARALDPDRSLSMVKVDGLAAVEAALRKLSQCSPAVKQRLIAAFTATIAADGEVNVAESELLRAIAATMDVPLPPMIAGH